MRLVVGALIAGVILYFLPGLRSGPACVVAGGLTTWLLIVMGPRSVVERLGTVMMVAMIAWVAGPRAAVPGKESLFLHLLGWSLVGAALTSLLRPRSE